jgi:hypothetical protein
VHLRFGPVARGGLRWSDRREDFRTEVLGLVKKVVRIPESLLEKRRYDGSLAAVNVQVLSMTEDGEPEEHA